MSKKKKKKLKVKLEVNSCYECPHSSNTAQEHDDPFTSQPASTTWFCNKAKRTYSRMIIDNPWIIDPECPLL